MPISDDEFSTVTKGIALNSAVTALFIFLILWLALRSFHLVFAVGITLAIGLIITAGIGVLVAGALNPISMAFAILFVGLGAGFSVQFNVRYRARRFVTHDLCQALTQSAELVGMPLTLAAAAAAVGFLSFTPTAYTGLAQLGKIAGCGMVIAYLASFTLLPALITLVLPPDERSPPAATGSSPDRSPPAAASFRRYRGDHSLGRRRHCRFNSTSTRSICKARIRPQSRLFCS
ncbi:MAG TPA: MMPL family transporter [Methylocella sp.]|nr:MMPL family transporter [Methylocella sp.]